VSDSDLGYLFGEVRGTMWGISKPAGTQNTSE
jgi:hypothetical protein